MGVSGEPSANNEFNGGASAAADDDVVVDG